MCKYEVQSNLYCHWGSPTAKLAGVDYQIGLPGNSQNLPLLISWWEKFLGWF